MIQVGDGIYVETSYEGGNVGCIVTDEGVILVNTPMFPADAHAWRQRISSLAGTEIAYIVNTDYRLQHIAGNCCFSAIIVAHETAWNEIQAHGLMALRRQIDEYKQTNPEKALALSEVEIVLPEIAVVDNLTLHKGGRTVEVLHFGGHTPAALGVYVPDSQVLFAGDLVVNGRHPDLSEADSAQWLNALERIQRMKVDVLVPGYGEVADLTATENIAAYISEIRQRVRDLYRQEASRRETVEKVRSAMADRYPVPDEEKEAFALQMRMGIERIYEELRRGA